MSNGEDTTMPTETTLNEPSRSGRLFGVWLPMGSEPKDGTPFLVWLGDGTVLSASWYCQVLCHQYPYATRAKFWMPMPPPPNK